MTTITLVDRKVHGANAAPRHQKAKVNPRTHFPPPDRTVRSCHSLCFAHRCRLLDAGPRRPAADLKDNPRFCGPSGRPYYNAQFNIREQEMRRTSHDHLTNLIGLMPHEQLKYILLLSWTLELSSILCLPVPLSAPHETWIKSYTAFSTMSIINSILC